MLPVQWPQKDNASTMIYIRRMRECKGLLPGRTPLVVEESSGGAGQPYRSCQQEKAATQMAQGLALLASELEGETLQ